MERLDVEFQSEGSTVRAWFYRADGGGRRPTVVLAGGWRYVREIVMPTYAKAFAAASTSESRLRLFLLRPGRHKGGRGFGRP